MKRIATIWTENLSDPEKKAEFEKLLRNSTITLSRLRAIVQKYAKELMTVERNPKVFDDPNWAYKQAYTNGMLHTYAKLDQLLSFMDKE